MDAVSTNSEDQEQDEPLGAMADTDTELDNSRALPRLPASSSNDVPDLHPADFPPPSFNADEIYTDPPPFPHDPELQPEPIGYYGDVPIFGYNGDGSRVIGILDDPASARLSSTPVTTCINRGCARPRNGGWLTCCSFCGLSYSHSNQCNDRCNLPQPPPRHRAVDNRPMPTEVWVLPTGTCYHYNGTCRHFQDALGTRGSRRLRKCVICRDGPSPAAETLIDNDAYWE